MWYSSRMSTLLRNEQVVGALSYLKIPSPEEDPIYMALLEMYECMAPRLTLLRDEVAEGVWFDEVKSHYQYFVDNQPRKIGFVISNEHQISQIYLFIIFITKGVIQHRSWISLDEKTPGHLIKLSSEVVYQEEPHL